MENIEDKKILIIDDDTFLLDMYAMKFKKEGFEVVAIPDAEMALNQLKEETMGFLKEKFPSGHFSILAAARVFVRLTWTWRDH